MPRKRKLLVVEDEEIIRKGLSDLFVFNGYDVTGCADGQEGLRLALNSAWDCILLDVMLPSLDGLSICREIRKHSREQPIVMLTAKHAEDDVISGLSLGADDYIAKPFSVRELLLRVDGILRRTGKDRTERELVIGSMTIDLDNLCAVAHHQNVEFTQREVDVLRFLDHHHERPVSRRELLSEVWGYNKRTEFDTRTIDIHIAKLRKKIEVDPSKPKLLVTVRGQGYRLHNLHG